MDYKELEKLTNALNFHNKKYKDYCISHIVSEYKKINKEVNLKEIIVIPLIGVTAPREFTVRAKIGNDDLTLIETLKASISELGRIRFTAVKFEVS